MNINTRIPLLAAALWWGLAKAQSSCSTTLTASYPAPSLADGYVAVLVANGLTSPRGIQFDSQGALLVVEQGVGISALNIVDAGSDCLSVANRSLVIDEPALNHGIQLSEDGSSLYASSGETLWSWDYSPRQQTNTSAPTALVTGMAGSDHTSRTLLLSKWAPGIMVINRGSNSNVDLEAADISTGHSQVKAFNITNATQPYDFNSDGLLLGWGLRNDVGIAEEPLTGRVYSVENSADEIDRLGKDVHQNNPAEELNFLGYLNGTQSSNQGRNFGYPECFTAWHPEDLPMFNGSVGDAFEIGNSPNDTACSSSLRQTPRLSFQAHTAPLDILFNEAGTAAWITFHGSWNRDSPVGYELAVVSFANGEPLASTTSQDAAIPIMSNQDLTACPDGCFRPVGLAWDPQGRLFMSSDATGEIYAIVRADGNATSTVGSNSTDTIPSGTAGAPSPTNTSGAGSTVGAGALAVAFALLAFLL